jgi:hypothetical protein
MKQQTMSLGHNSVGEQNKQEIDNVASLDGLHTANRCHNDVLLQSIFLKERQREKGSGKNDTLEPSSSAQTFGTLGFFNGLND